MSEGKAKREKDRAEDRAPQSFAELCQRMMTAGAREGCGSQMQEMMSRCIARFSNEQGEPSHSGETRRS